MTCVCSSQPTIGPNWILPVLQASTSPGFGRPRRFHAKRGWPKPSEPPCYVTLLCSQTDFSCDISEAVDSCTTGDLAGPEAWMALLPCWIRTMGGGGLFRPQASGTPFLGQICGGRPKPGGGAVEAFDTGERKECYFKQKGFCT